MKLWRQMGRGALGNKNGRAAPPPLLVDCNDTKGFVFCLALRGLVESKRKGPLQTISPTRRTTLPRAVGLVVVGFGA